MPDLFLLGAGFSRAVSDRMPLTDDLDEDNDAIASFITRSGLRSKNVEAMLTLLSESQPWLSEDENLRNRADFIAFSQEVKEHIRKRQVEAIKDGDGRPPHWLDVLVLRWIKDKSTILTFNYDTLVEKAITYSLRSEHESAREEDKAWLHAPVYDVPIPRITSRIGLAGQPPLPEEAGRLPSLIKLHGSLNWYYSGSESSSGEVIYDIGIRPFWESSREDRRDGAMQRFSAGKVSLIIPPTSGKSSFFSNETVRSQWMSAREALKDARNIYMIGYSLPPSDHMARFLLKSTCAQGSGRRSKNFVVVNPEKEVSKELEELLDCDARSYLTVEDFVKSIDL